MDNGVSEIGTVGIVLVGIGTCTQNSRRNTH